MKRLLAAILLVCSAAVSHAVSVEHTNYQEFIKSIEAGEVSEVHFVDIATIEWKESGIEDKVFITGTPISPRNDPLLLRLLENKRVSIVRSSADIVPKPLLSYGYSTFDLLWFIVWVQLAMFAFLVFKLRRKRADSRGGPNKSPEATPGQRPLKDPGPSSGAPQL
jgi:ATP-dependent Zn protease